jgi:hypothetical protein
MKSVAAVFAGFVCMSLLVIAATAAAGALLLQGSSPTGPYVVVNLLYSTAFAAVGGYLTAHLAPRRPRSHVAALALLVALMGAASAAGSAPSAGQPGWYGWTVGVLGVAGILVGGSLHGRAGRATGSSPAVSPRA